jgi:ubiquinol-cytochrome c reductase cytochrome b subunit
MLALLGMLFIASSTDVLANFFHVSLNTVLWAMRVLCILAPIVAYPITYKICKELQGVKGGGKRKTPNVVTRTAEGEYVATPAPVYVDDLHHGREATEVPQFISADTEEPGDSGVRVVER